VAQGVDTLRFEEIGRLVRILVGIGVVSVRLTGGESLVRRNLSDLVAKLTAIDGLEDLSLTTSGYLLEEQADALSAAGLQRVNVSIDSLGGDGEAMRISTGAMLPIGAAGRQRRRGEPSANKIK
jgi:cyclic pyranopterin phosphate synthase